MYKFNIDPFPAVRSNRNSWTPRTKVYHDKMNLLRHTMGMDIHPVIYMLLQWGYEITFTIPMPKSWSKQKREEMDGKPHTQTPDKDNLEKAFVDTVFYGREINDCAIHSGWARKIWGEFGSIYIVKK